MAFTSSPGRRLVYKVAVILICAIAWLACWQIAQSIFNFTVWRESITLVYVPAGVRLVILLISGIWGAIGIALAFPFALMQVFPDITWQEALAYSAIAGFVPYVTVLVICRLARISSDLRSLRPMHLPMLAAAVSITGGLSYTAALVGFSRFDASRFLPDVTGMVAGDFLGCFAVIVLVRVSIRLGRTPR